jgi:geranylgeranyl pyrophosphate synthase
LEESVRMADQLIAQACAALDSFGARADTLEAIARYLVERKK